MLSKPKIIAEIGVCWGGDFQLAKKYIEVAAAAGCDYVKFQTRTPEEDVPRDQWDIPRVPPWGGPAIPYIEYRKRMEFSDDQYHELNVHCKERGILWSTSVWGLSAMERMKAFDLPWIKIPSAKMTDYALIRSAADYCQEKNKKLLISTGMSTDEEILDLSHFLSRFPRELLVVFNCNSSYPTPTEEINLSAITRLRNLFSCDIGFSSHSTTLGTTVASVYLGYTWIEAHITHDRSLPGDHNSAVSFHGFFKLVSGVNDLVKAYGDGKLRLYDSEVPFRNKLRGVSPL